MYNNVYIIFFKKAYFIILSDPPLTVSLTSNLTDGPHAEGTHAEVRCEKDDCYPENPLLVLGQEENDDLALTNDNILYYPIKLDREDNLLTLSCCAGRDVVWGEVCSANPLRPNVTCMYNGTVILVQSLWFSLILHS